MCCMQTGCLSTPSLDQRILGVPERNFGPCEHQRVQNASLSQPLQEGISKQQTTVGNYTDPENALTHRRRTAWNQPARASMSAALLLVLLAAAGGQLGPERGQQPLAACYSAGRLRKTTDAGSAATAWQGCCRRRMSRPLRPQWPLGPAVLLPPHRPQQESSGSQSQPSRKKAVGPDQKGLTAACATKLSRTSLAVAARSAVYAIRSV